ncbi:MAG: hypothetical protein MI725_14230 [Pirellulales bacterium]|nr:hypothetical protein [Pirellulales bacterium]
MKSDDTGTPEVDPEAATLRSLSLLTGGRPLDFVDHDSPPGWAGRWLRRASLRQVQGLLLMTLRRWHELHQR